MAIGLMKGHIRSMKDALDSRIGCPLPVSHPLLTWLVRHASHTYRLFHRGPDGRTPMERISGIRSRPHVVAEFGERIWWMPLDSSGRGPLDAKCQDGFYVGRNSSTNETLVITASGVVRTRTFWRRPLSERWDPELYSMSATVLQPSTVDPMTTTIHLQRLCYSQLGSWRQQKPQN